jgi:hypothetical protein
MNMDPRSEENPTPKVFVSYAQSEERTAWISDVCQRLMHDGIDVVADLYELPHSADIHAFMERCVNDPSITRVLMFCDKLYCRKADERRGGVGKETQIISEEVYNHIGKTKFLPIFCDFYDDGRPSLPTYLRSRLAIDFSTTEKVQENWKPCSGIFLSALFIKSRLSANRRVTSRLHNYLPGPPQVNSHLGGRRKTGDPVQLRSFFNNTLRHLDWSCAACI